MGRRTARPGQQAEDRATSAAERRSDRRFAAGVAATLAAAAAVLAVGLSDDRDGADGPGLRPVGPRPAPAVASAADVPPVRSARLKRELGRLSEQADLVVEDDVAARLARLRGVPVVVNVWASWCPSCREEFEFFAGLRDRYDGKVAFLGLSSNDDRDDAERFLREFPSGYPSLEDPDARQARSIGAGVGWPTTVFYDASGERRFVRQGGYTSQAALDADLRTYAIR